MKSYIILLIIAFLIVASTGCQKVFDHNPTKAIEEISIPAGFTFNTDKDVEIAGSGSSSKVDVYAVGELDTVYMGRYSTNQSELITLSADREILTVPVGVQPTKETLKTASYSTNNTNTLAAASPKRVITQISGNVYSIGGWDINGLPDYLEPNRDAIDANFVNDINASLPETRPVPQYNPEYLNGKDMVTAITELADVWVTFVHEGAGWKNALGYFTYPKGNKPATLQEVDSLFVLFPNVSFTNSGGALQTGDKVYLGRFPADTEIAWFLIPNGFSTGTGNLTVTDQIKSSINDQNTYTPAAYKQHTILLNDSVRELLLLGFEDTTRPAGDNDFNDAIFFVSANPYRAIETIELLPVKEAVDTDGDGVFDHEDNYPNDAERAYDSYYPSISGTGSFLVEDLWPAKGDYDFNDLVADLNIHFQKNAQNNIKQMRFRWTVKAVGGYQQNGLFMQLPISPDLVESVTGTQIFDSYVTLNAKGLEANQSNAVLVFTDNLSKVLPAPSGYRVTNVLDEQPKVNTKSFDVTIVFNQPISSSILGSAPFDPFLVANMQRHVEIHLPGKTPTDLAAQGMLGSEDDSSSINGRPNYTTSQGLPWAMFITSAIPHVKESMEFTNGYLRFADWASSNGTANTDWFQNKTNYRNSGLLYLK